MKNENNEEPENFDQLIIESKELEQLSLENKNSKISMQNDNKDEKFTSFKKDTNFRFNFIENPLYKDLLDKELFSSKEIRIDEKDKYVFVSPFYNIRHLMECTSYFWIYQTILL